MSLLLLLLPSLLAGGGGGCCCWARFVLVELPESLEVDVLSLKDVEAVVATDTVTWDLVGGAERRELGSSGMDCIEV